jgi:phosphoribosylanthranilate isomerase
MIPLKICGLRDSANIQAIAALKPDFVGFIFYPKSPRWVGSDFGHHSLAGIPNGIKKIGVFVNEEPDLMLQIAKQVGLDGVQLHGQETPATAAFFKSEGLLVLKAFGLNAGFNAETLPQFEDSSTHFLFDTATPLHGGSGKSFDWTLLENLSINLPSFLSGGISLQNVDAALETAFRLGLGLDVNSGLETSPGLKDIPRATEFIERVRTFHPSHHFNS